LKVFTLGSSALGMQGFGTYGTQTESKKKKKNSNTVHEEKGRRRRRRRRKRRRKKRQCGLRGVRRLDLT
jgi:hypothetical protein